MVTLKPEFLVVQDENLMLVALVTIALATSTPGMAFKILCLC